MYCSVLATANTEQYICEDLLVGVREGNHATDTALAVHPAPGEGAHRDPPPGDPGQVAAQVLEHADVAPGRLVVDVLEPLHRQRILDGLAGAGFVFFHEVRPHPA